MRKAFLILLVLMLTMIMLGVALADGTFVDNQAYPNGVAGTTAISSITFKSALSLADGETEGTYVPSTVFSYSIASGSGKSYTDSTANKTLNVLAGPAGGAMLSDALGVITSDDDGAEDTVTISFDTSAFDTTGVYRYVITQADLSDSQTGAGIIADKDGAVKYLDVYVRRNNSGLYVSNAVLFNDLNQTYTASASADSDMLYYDSSADTAVKEDGFENTYETATITLEKQIDGGMADSNVYFPFEIALSNSNLTVAGASPVAGSVTGTTFTVEKTAGDVQKGSVAFTSESQALSNSGLTLNYSMKADGKITIKGLPLNTAALIKETYNNAEGYTVKYSVDEADAVAIDMNVNTSTIAPDASDSEKDVVFTNTLNAVSPTGIVLQYAPYIALGLIAFIGLMILINRRNDNENSSNI